MRREYKMLFDRTNHKTAVAILEIKQMQVSPAADLIIPSADDFYKTVVAQAIEQYPSYASIFDYVDSFGCDWYRLMSYITDDAGDEHYDNTAQYIDTLPIETFLKYVSVTNIQIVNNKIVNIDINIDMYRLVTENLKLIPCGNP